MQCKELRRSLLDQGLSQKGLKNVLKARLSTHLESRATAPVPRSRPVRQARVLPPWLLAANAVNVAARPAPTLDTDTRTAVALKRFTSILPDEDGIINSEFLEQILLLEVTDHDGCPIYTWSTAKICSFLKLARFTILAKIVRAKKITGNRMLGSLEYICSMCESKVPEGSDPDHSQLVYEAEVLIPAWRAALELSESGVIAGPAGGRNPRTKVMPSANDRQGRPRVSLAVSLFSILPYLHITDNIDFGLAGSAEEAHYMTLLACRERVDFSHLEQHAPRGLGHDFGAGRVVPNKHTSTVLRNGFICAVVRVLLIRVKYLRGFGKHFTKHSSHFVKAAMYQKSDRRPLGMINANESDNAGKDKVCSIISRYVPITKIGSAVVQLMRIFVFGDQKTCRVLIGHIAGTREAWKFPGIVPAFADWHAWKALFDGWFPIFFSQTHANVRGSWFNITAACKLSRKIPDEPSAKKFNTQDDHLEATTKSLFVSAYLELSGVESASACEPRVELQFPSHMDPANELHVRGWLGLLGGMIVDLHIMPFFDIAHLAAVHEPVKAKNKLVPCPFPDCIHPGFPSNTCHAFIAHQGEHLRQGDQPRQHPDDKPPQSGTPVLDYWQNIMAMGAMRAFFRETKATGDGHKMVHVLYRHLFPLYLSGNNLNYQNEVTRLLYQVCVSLSPAEAVRVMYARFVNRRGGPNNLEDDLDNEHFNRLVKMILAKLAKDRTAEACIDAVRRSLFLLGIFYEAQKSAGCWEPGQNRRRTTEDKVVDSFVRHFVQTRALALDNNEVFAQFTIKSLWPYTRFDASYARARVGAELARVRDVEADYNHQFRGPNDILLDRLMRAGGTPY